MAYLHSSEIEYFEDADSTYVHKSLAALVLVEQQGQVLLVTTHWPDVGMWWQLPGGVIESDEPLPQALHQHVFQEAGLSVVVEDLLYVMEIDEYMIFTFQARLSGSDSLDSAKVDCCFVPIDQLRTLPLLMGREPLLEWLGQRGQSRRYHRLSNATLRI